MVGKCIDGISREQNLEAHIICNQSYKYRIIYNGRNVIDRLD